MVAQLSGKPYAKDTPESLERKWEVSREEHASNRGLAVITTLARRASEGNGRVDLNTSIGAIADRIEMHSR